jgi:hypothetical protein
MNKDKINSLIIFLLMIVTGFIIYYIYLKPEPFDCITNPNDPLCKVTNNAYDTESLKQYCSTVNTTPSISSIISRYFGVGFNVYPVQSSLSTQLYLIEHIPIRQDGVAGGCYSLSTDGFLTIKIKNNDDPTQWWSITELTDPNDDSTYEVVQPYNNNNMALQYANGSISINPFTDPGYESQKWLKSQSTVSRGIPVLNVSPASMFTTEFDPYSSNNSIPNNLSDSNNIQVNNVLNAIKTGFQQYLSKVNPNSQITSSSLGNKNMPLSVNLNLNPSGSSSASGSVTGSDTDSTKGISFFDNVTGSTSESDMLSILDKYDPNSNNNSNNSQTLYTNNSLQKQLDTTRNGCKLFNINDYMSNRVSTCNCKL